MKRPIHGWSVVTGGLILVGGLPVHGATAMLSFNADIQPILSENCYACHGPDAAARKGELRLDRAEAALAPRQDGGPVIVPGEPDRSPLIRRIESADAKERMPPPEAHKSLGPGEKALLRRWIAEGAGYEDHWAFMPARRPALPPVTSRLPAWSRNAIDRFVLARLGREGLAPSAEADRATLLRRLTFDLTGLPPTPEELDGFVADRLPGAYERVVDRLLASPRFGEHRARYWLDYVRYGDTHGINSDNLRSIWPYRDYVIRSLNANKPFDRFVREQLAGDLLPGRTLDELTATGYIRCNLTTNEGGTVPEELAANVARDRVEAFGVTFLGLTLGCAACHDHKFDPITQRDFYGLAAYFGNTADKSWDLNIAAPAPVLRLPNERNRATAEAVLERRAELQQKLDARRARSRELIGGWLAAGNRPQAVSTGALEMRLRLDEGAGDVVKNSAPAGPLPAFTATTNPLIWGERTWLWPAMRMDILTRLPLGNSGDVEAGDKFSGGGWLMLRLKPGGGIFADTGNGSLLARMRDDRGKPGVGWELHHESLRFIVRLMSDKPGAGVVVASRETFTRDEWLHVFFSYDGSRRAAGVRLYVNGRPAATDVKMDTLGAASIRTDATTHLGRRDDGQPMRESRFQDVRIYRRALAPDEVRRLPFEDLAAEIVARQPDPGRWCDDEVFVAADRYFLGEVDPETKALASAVAAHQAAFDALTADGTPTLIAVEKATPAYADVLKRGDYHARVERVPPTTPQALPPPAPTHAPRNRRGLAEWLIADDQPLFARVTVNRMWQEIFGCGLVETTDDFGVMGARPSHPELLDWLAVEFRESGWDMKKLYRLLVTTAAYRQSPVVTADRLARDPDNRLLSRGPRFRMEAEMLRDAALAVSGLLVERVGGVPAKPYQPPGLWEEVAIPGSNTRRYEPDRGEGQYRRSVYTFWKRSSPPPSMETFDAPTREAVCVRRPRSTTPLQALVTLNDPQWTEAARKLAERALRGGNDDTVRVAVLARLAFARSLDATEHALVKASLARHRAHFAIRPADARELLTVGETPADATPAPWEVAAWTLLASEFLNADEFLSK